MGLFDKLKQTVANAVSSEVDLSTLTPEQRRNYEMHMARGEAARTGSVEAVQRFQEARTLRGPAAEYLYGPQYAWVPPTVEELERIRREHGARAMAKASQPPVGGLRHQLREAFDDTLGRQRGPDEVEDERRRSEIASAERAARDAARQPFLSPTCAELVIARIAATGKSQVDDVATYLGKSGLAARPDLVWGVYRVPDRIDPHQNTGSERSRVVEWDIVHVPGHLPPAEPPVAVHIAARPRWIGCRLGEPAPLDEDVGRVYARYAGIGPDDCLGIARHLDLRRFGSTEDGGNVGVQTFVEGVDVFHRAGSADALRRLTDDAPVPLDLDELPEAFVETLDWEEISRIVHPAANRPPRVPNPIPYLPSTPQELLEAYLRVVGIAPSDCWSAQVTVSTVRTLAGQTGFVTHNLGEPLPCADGTSRPRLHGAEQIVVAYRDRPEYVVGRERWAAYQSEVLQARLDVGSNHREPLQRHDFESAVVRGVLKPIDIIDQIYHFGIDQPPPPHRYCWPPLDA